jgi:hypothetical protein
VAKLPRTCIRCHGDLERGRGAVCVACAAKAMMREAPPPLAGWAWMEPATLPAYERVVEVYGREMVERWLREVHGDPTHRTPALTAQAMNLTITSADEVAPWWQRASAALGPDAHWSKVWPEALRLLLAEPSRDPTPPGEPRTPDYWPGGVPDALERQRDYPGGVISELPPRP